MIKVKGLFAVSLIAILMAGGVAVNSAVAAIASKGYVDQVAATHVQSSEQTPNAILTTDADGNVQATAQITQSQVDGLTDALNAKADTNDIPTKTSDLNNDSGFITSRDLPGKYELPVATEDALGGVKSGGDIAVNNATGAVTVQHADNADTATSATTATTATNATNATNDADGNEITETYATKDELTSGLAGKQATLSAAQLNAVNSGITSAKVTTYDGYNAKITAAQTAADDAADAAAAAQAAANGKVTANAAITAGTATKITYDAKGLVTGGASLTASDIPTIPSTKVSGLSTVATSGSYNDLADKPSIPSAYVLKAATADALGGVKSGGDITVATSGAVTVSHAAKADTATNATNATNADHADTATSATSATNATNATKATQDASGRVITTTYATKSEITGLNSSSTGSGAVVTDVSQSAGEVSVTRGNVKIPVGGENATSYATIWIE